MIAIQISERGGPDLGIYRLAAVPRIGEALYFREAVLGSRVWSVMDVIYRPEEEVLQVLLMVERLDADRSNAS